MLNPRTLIREAQGTVLESYLRHRDFSWPGAAVSTLSLQDRMRIAPRFLRELEREQHQILHDDAQRVLAMGDEVGGLALQSLTALAADLAELENDVSRALWLLVHKPHALALAEQHRFLDGKRNGRMWSGFATTRDLAVLEAEEVREAFRSSLAEHFDKALVAVECGWRSRPNGDDSVRLYQADIFHEGWLNTRKAFVDNQLAHVAGKVVHEAAVTYEPASGTIEVVAPQKPQREAIARIFAEHLLASADPGKPLQIRQYSLNQLRWRHAFPCEVGHQIESVRLVQLRLTAVNAAGVRLSIECADDRGPTIWDVAEERFGDRNPLTAGYRVLSADIRIRFAASGRRRGRSLMVKLREPNGCNLKETIEMERLIGQHYLGQWGLAAKV